MKAAVQIGIDLSSAYSDCLIYECQKSQKLYEAILAIEPVLDNDDSLFTSWKIVNNALIEYEQTKQE